MPRDNDLWHFPGLSALMSPKVQRKSRLKELPASPGLLFGGVSGSWVTHLPRGLSSVPNLLVGTNSLPGGQEGVGGVEAGCRAREASAHVVASQAQHCRRSVLAEQHPAPAPARVDVCQKGGDGREVSGEVVVHILGLPGEVLGGDDAVGAHLGGEGTKR